MVNNWKTQSLREAGVALIDCDHRTPPAVAAGYPYVTIPQIKKGRIDLSHARRITHDHFLEWTRKARPQRYDVVLSRRCNPGETAFVGSDAEFALGQNLVLLRSDGSQVYPPFLRWLVRGREWWEQIGKFLNVGAVFDSLKCADIPNFELPIPPMDQQSAIADVLGALDDKIELNRRMNQTLEVMAKALFKAWFIEPAETGLRDGWREGILSDLCEIAIGGDWGEEKSFEGSVEAICLRGVDLEHLRGNGHADAPRRWLKESSILQRQLDESDVLVAASGLGPTGRSLWAFSGLQRIWGFPVIYSNFCKRLRCQSPAAAVYVDRLLYMMRESGEIWEYVNGTSIPNLDAKSLLRTRRIPIPPSEVLEQFHEFYRPIAERLYSWESRSLAALRDALLPKLLSGAIRANEIT